MLLSLKLVNMNELMEANDVDEVNFGFIGLPFTDAGVGKQLPTIGRHSIVMYTLTNDEVDDVLNGYKSGFGTLTDIADVEKIIDNAKMLVDIIEEIYLEKGGKLVHE